MTDTDLIDAFIARWKPSGGSEMSNAQSFASELTVLLGVEPPKPATEDGQNDDYRFERPVTFTHTGKPRQGRIDLYKKQCFVLEAKQGSDASQRGHGRRATPAWDDTMLRARGQADGYARAVSKEDGWPPFLIVVDVGHVIELYADFSAQGQGYSQFPDGNRYRIALDDLRDPEIRKLLATVWNDPLTLDPSLHAARITREIASHLADLGRSFERQGHGGEAVARFLMRCLFSMFAEDVELIPAGSFTGLLKRLRSHPAHAVPSLESLWATMNTGGFSPILTEDLKRFNGGLFRDSGALPLDANQLEMLIEAAEADWKQVEPAIFGTLLERALDKRQRHKLGAHFTPRAYVERLVVPTIMEPLRADWKDVQTAALTLANQGKLDDARKTVHRFHRKLCDTRVLDPACGSGNFLYVALEMMKRLEGEVTALLRRDLGEDQAALGLSGHTVDPHQFLGIELNPWAAAVAELVLWIGYLQWHFRTHGQAAPSEPVLRDFRNIENRDAVLDWDSATPRHDEQGRPVTRWDGITTIRHNVTGEEVPDPEARTQVLDYSNPRAASWPEAEFIVGNPPFIGASRLRESLGDGYAEAMWQAYPKMPQSADLVMFWWEKAALKARAWKPSTGKGTRRFGFITTNSLRQTFNRRVLEPHLNDPKKPLSLLFAIPDHPWVDAQLGAAVRIAMTVAGAGRRDGVLMTVSSETRGRTEDEGREVNLSLENGMIFSNLRVGADVAGAKALKANSGVSSPGVKLHGAGFIVTRDEAVALGLGTVPGIEAHIREYRNGRDLTARPRYVLVIDLFGLSEREVRDKFPAVYQRVFDTVKPERDLNNRRSRRDKWWIFGEPVGEIRPALANLRRYIATVETTKHRTFQFLEIEILPDNMLTVFAVEDAAHLAALSSRIHVIWSLAAGGRLGVGNDPRYNKSRCFAPFPFPDPSEPHRLLLRDLGEELDAHRKRQQAAHPSLTLTKTYNVLEKLRAGEAIEGADREIYDQGLVGILRDLHDRIDAAVADAYGWPANLSDDEILVRLVALNKKRAVEEAAGHVRWLRPEFQNPGGRQAAGTGAQSELEIGEAASAEKALWPKEMPDQIAAVRQALGEMGEASAEQVARQFKRARTASVTPLLDSLVALGQAGQTEDGRYAA